jgi:hypothetical protein
LASYAELIGFMELTPWDAPAYRQDEPDANMRKMLFEGIAVDPHPRRATPRDRRQRDVNRLSTDHRKLTPGGHIGDGASRGWRDLVGHMSDSS